MRRSILEIFKITAESGSFEKASKQLFISSTALIKQINKLESDTDLKLFHRTNRGIFLTDSGKYFYNKAIKMIEDYQSAIQHANNIQTAQERTLRMGISMINPYKHLTQDFDYGTNIFHNSNVTIVPIACNYTAFNEQFHSIGDEVDIIPYILGNKDLDLICDSLPVVQTHFRIAVPANHPLSKKKQLTYDDLENETIITLNNNINIYYDEVMNAIAEHTSNVNFHITNFLDFSAFDYAIRNNFLILISDYLKDIHPSLFFLPVCWDFTIPYGIYYSKSPSFLVQEAISSFSNFGITGDLSNIKLMEF